MPVSNVASDWPRTFLHPRCFCLAFSKFHVLIPQVKTADSPCDFLTSPTVKQSVKELLHKGKESKLIWHEIRIVIAYLAAHIICWNRQRPRVVQCMTVDEWFEHVEEDGESG